MKKTKRTYCPGTFELLISKQIVHCCKLWDINLTPLLFDFMEEQKAKGNLCVDWRLQFHRYVVHKAFFNQAPQGFTTDFLYKEMDLKDMHE